MSNHRKQITIRDIAKRVEVSAATVSNVLNGKDTVDPAIRKSVLDIAKQLEYKLPTRQRDPLRVEAKMIAMISADVTDPVMTLIFKGVENTTQLYGYHAILSDSMNNEETEKECIESLLKKGISGFIIQPAGNNLPGYELLARKSCPCVIVDRKISGFDVNSVTSDNEEGAYQAVKYLLSLGHTNILFIAGPKNVSTADDRLQGCRRALKEARIDFKNELIVSGNFNWEDAYQAVEETIRKKINFSSIFAANDTMALAAKEVLERNGLKVPSDISIIGYNDIRFASATSLTTVALDAFEMGKNAMILLLDLINKRRQSPHHIIMQPRLVIRNSCQMIG